MVHGCEDLHIDSSFLGGRGEIFIDDVGIVLRRANELTGCIIRGEKALEPEPGISPITIEQGVGDIHAVFVRKSFDQRRRHGSLYLAMQFDLWDVRRHVASISFAALHRTFSDVAPPMMQTG